jgi:hypothetical protein
MWAYPEIRPTGMRKGLSRGSKPSILRPSNLRSLDFHSGSCQAVETMASATYLLANFFLALESNIGVDLGSFGVKKILAIEKSMSISRLFIMAFPPKGVALTVLFGKMPLTN